MGCCRGRMGFKGRLSQVESAGKGRKLTYVQASEELEEKHKEDEERRGGGTMTHRNWLCLPPVGWGGK